MQEVTVKGAIWGDYHSLILFSLVRYGHQEEFLDLSPCPGQ